jgi:hypothetical protein
MEGLRKVIVVAAALLLETGAFVFAVVMTKHADVGMLTAYFAAVAASLAVYSAANVVSKFSPPPE